MIVARNTMTTTELYPAYFFPCKRCKQNIWVNVTTLQFGGDRTIFAHAIDGRFGAEEFAVKVYELDIQVAQLRAENVNATPPGMNLQVVTDRLPCDFCKAEFSLASLNRGRRLQDGGAFNCVSCHKEGFVEFEVVEETPLDIPAEKLPAIITAIRSGFADPETLLAIASMRIVVAEDAIVPLDRLSLAPSTVSCMYCGVEQAARMNDISPLR